MYSIIEVKSELKFCLHSLLNVLNAFSSSNIFFFFNPASFTSCVCLQSSSLSLLVLCSISWCITATCCFSVTAVRFQFLLAINVIFSKHECFFWPQHHCWRHLTKPTTFLKINHIILVPKENQTLIILLSHDKTDLLF